MLTRLATTDDLEVILPIIEDARKHLASSGSFQWQGIDGYPDSQTILSDIESKQGFVVEVGDNIVAYVAVIVGRDSSYDTIYDGQWRNPDNDNYVTFHRIAVSSNYRGQKIIQKMLSELIEKSVYSDFRCDTSAKNLSMQHILKKLGYQATGKVDYDEVTCVTYQLLK